MRLSLARAGFEALESRRLLAQITGFTFYDRDASGSYESATDWPLQGATAYLDLDDSGTFEAGEPSATSNSGGAFAIDAAGPGDYRVRVAFPQGYTSSYPATGYADVSVVGSEVVSAGSFGAWRTGAVAGYIYHDHDADGINGDDTPFTNGQV